MRKAALRCLLPSFSAAAVLGLLGGCDTGSAYRDAFAFSTAPTHAPVMVPTRPMAPIAATYGSTSRPAYTPAYTPTHTPVSSTPVRGSPIVSDATDAAFAHQLASAGPAVVLYFTATWCGPCRAVGPTLESLTAEQGGRVKMIRIDFDRCPATVKKYGVSALPAVITLRNGVVVNRMVGAQSRENLARAMATARP